MTTTNAVFKTKVTTEITDDASPVVAGNIYNAMQSVVVDTSAAGDYIDINGKPAANDAPVSVRIPNGNANAVVSAGAEITPAEFSLVEIVTSTSGGNSLRGEPVADQTELGLLVAKEGGRRYVKADNSDYHFKLTADLSTTEDASSSSVANAAGTGKWVRQSFAALVDGYTYSGIDVANSSFGAGAIGFRHGGFNTIYDPKGLVDTDGTTITIDSPEKAGAYLMALNVTSGTVSGRVNTRVNGNTVLIASGEDGADSDAAVGVVELVEGDVVTLAITGGGTTYGVSFTMSQVRRFVDETQYVAADQVTAVEEQETLLIDTNSDATGNNLNNRFLAYLNGATKTSIQTDYKWIDVWIGNVKESGNNTRNDFPVQRYPVEVLTPDPDGNGVIRILNNVNTVIMSEANTAETGITLTATSNDGKWALKMWGVKESFNITKIPATDVQVDVTEVGTPHKAGSTRQYVMQWDGTKMINTLAKEIWTSGTRGSTNYFRYMIDHLTQTGHIIGSWGITSTGTVSWPDLAFANAEAYVFAHDLREAQAETASLRINSRTTTSINYTLHDSAGTGDGGSVVKFMISGEL